MDFIQWDEEDSLESLNWNEYNTLDKYHSHFLLLDDGRMNVYLDDRPRSDFVQKMCSKTNCHSITIIIEGGFNTLEVIKNDLKNKRPVVIIHGSGRLANVLGTLLEVSSKKNTLENTDVEQQIALFFPEHERELDEVIMQNIIANIREVLKMEYRNYLNIFKLERDTSLTDTIIKAMDKESRISAALIAACIARRLSLFAINLDLRRTFDQQTKDYEEYASACVTACYKHNERLACQLLVRENLLFGDVTCMQIAIASRNIPFINTDCFNTVLTKGWVDQLACNITEPSNSTVNFLVSLLTLGLAAPYLMKYREADTDNGTNQDHFLADLYTQMVEKQDKSRSWIAFFRAMIYILFYIGIIFHFKSTNRPGLFKVARIILAIDLELWFLFSLRFVSAIRLLGPKLFMIQNMVSKNNF
ncbi:unnamed protein product [Rotaria sordida]|uniref:TRPM SLOG domain-containing protein n=1 Tax=Rotaria sordida TaxID=392033 RepID=A0A819MAZ8_9BILA|nr:unnamed protein product [Rotaria sordida]